MHFLLQAADAQQWLKAACRMAMEGPMASTAADFACAREQAFPVAEENGFRHLRTSDFSDSVAALPPEELQVLLPVAHIILLPDIHLKAGQHIHNVHDGMTGSQDSQLQSQELRGLLSPAWAGLPASFATIIGQRLAFLPWVLLKRPHNWSGLIVQAAVMGGARNGPGGHPGQQVALGEGEWEQVLNQLPQEAAAELQTAGHGKPYP